MKTELKWPRILVVLASIALIGALFLPIWRIDLDAPQYPEGLRLLIYANNIAGDVDVINGLNHYIGMKTLHTDDFIEFTILPYLISGLVVLGLLTAFFHKKKIYYTYIALFMFIAIISMVDFYRWEYNYGHNLDPHAAIQVPGMSYQPPLIGFKQLLNFGAYSIPATGGWLFIGAGVLLFTAYILILRPKFIFKRHSGKKVAVASLFAIILQSCSAGPQAIKYGSDACDYCKMTIMDKRFAAEYVTNKSKAFKFDDIHCMIAFLKNNQLQGAAYVNDYTGKKELNKAEQLLYIHSDKIKSPMGGNVAATLTENDATTISTSLTGELLHWEEVKNKLK
jgi:copper chaperone NosL